METENTPERIYLGEGVSISPSTQADVDYVESHFRPGDQLEHDSLGGGRTIMDDLFEQCWTVRNGEDIIGYCGVAIQAGEPVISANRWLCYMSTVHADKAKIKYVKYSRRVMAEIVRRTRPWVQFYFSLPNIKYRGSVLWHQRVLKMHETREITFCGETFKMFGATRKELTE